MPLLLKKGKQADKLERKSLILRIGDQVPTLDVFWPKHLHVQEVRSNVNIHVQSM